MRPIVLYIWSGYKYIVWPRSTCAHMDMRAHAYTHPHTHPCPLHNWWGLLLESLLHSSLMFQLRLRHIVSWTFSREVESPSCLGPLSPHSPEWPGQSTACRGRWCRCILGGAPAHCSCPSWRSASCWWTFRTCAEGARPPPGIERAGALNYSVHPPPPPRPHWLLSAPPSPSYLWPLVQPWLNIGLPP